ncbi:hypothetical protein BGZ61DRAFT_469748 [Ilyonectria robusta]|uniref:uncharacterized protein n=1 Tax=Ilyonectria robusta TaxID=1079257 RepID=UPI001E8D5B32|nr:uncharacterized protein BGZ61DRAFT_469748 [Ilyonectria robusta]KAH8648262.1 hypothetical protein BGZ61DRAFT_469748 [Ilyonectria robusta]
MPGFLAPISLLLSSSFGDELRFYHDGGFRQAEAVTVLLIGVNHSFDWTPHARHFYSRIALIALKGFVNFGKSLLISPASFGQLT